MKNFAFMFALIFALCSLGQAETPSSCIESAGFIIDPHRPIGSADRKIPIKHIIFIMQENHSFDSYFGKLTKTYGDQVDGLSQSVFEKEPRLYHDHKYCIVNPWPEWDNLHEAWDGGKNDRFYLLNQDAYAYYDESDLNYYYALANRFAIADRYFASAIAPTFANRLFFMQGTAAGEADNKLGDLFGDQKTIFDLLSENDISWRYYTDDIPAAGLVPHSMLKHLWHMTTMPRLQFDLYFNQLPEVVFIDHSLFHLNEEPPKDFQLGELAVARHINAIIHSQAWKSSAIFFTYDEGGGFYDHVAPPPACVPDDIPPRLETGQFQAGYDRYGFRVPFLVISPFAKSHYVSHEIYDHTSMLKFIEKKFNLPALTRRDANANDLTDLFDFSNPQYKVNLPKPFVDPDIENQCR